MTTPDRKPSENPIGSPSPGGLIEALRRQIERLEGARHPRDEGPVCGACPPLERLLPDRGFRRGTLVEWLAGGEGTGAETLALRVAACACSEGGALVVLDRLRQFYPPAAARLGVELEQTIVVHAPAEADAAWALDQALRCPAVAAVLAWPEGLDGRSFRRLQLAAEEGGGLGLLLRPEGVRGEPSWADVRLLVEPLPSGGGESGQWIVDSGQKEADIADCKLQIANCQLSDQVRTTAHFLSTGRRLRIGVLRCRGGTSGGSVEVEIDDETNTVHPAAGLARHQAGARAAGA